MERVVPLPTDTGGPYKQILAAEKTAQSLQAWIQEKNDIIRTGKQQALDHGIPDDVIDGHVKQLEEDIGRFKQLLEYIEASRNHWREMHMTAWRATVSPLKVVDMPNEILQMIFGNLQDVPVGQRKVHTIHAKYTLPSPDVASIKNIRLTCHTFCDNGSKFLLPIAHIYFTRSSLQRLEDISNHPTISEGVRGLQVHANPYNALLSNDRDRFIRTTHQKFRMLQERICKDVREVTQVSDASRLDGVIPEPELSRANELNEALTEGDRVMEAMSKVLHATRTENTLDHFENNIKNALDQAHDEYGRRYLEQQSLMRDRQVHDNIATAVRKMRSIKGLCITDLGRRLWDDILRSGLGRRYDAQKYKALMGSPNPFWDLVVRANIEDSLLDWDRTPRFSLLNKLPLVLEAASTNLTRLDIIIPPTLSVEVLAADLPNVRRACQNLRFVSITVTQIAATENTRFRFRFASLPTTYTLMDALLSSPRLEVVELQLTHGATHQLFSSADSLGSVLANLPWDTLRSVFLYGFPVKVEELQQAFEDVTGKIHLDLNGVYLMQGTWAQALEILRGKADSSSHATNPRGIELRRLHPLQTRGFRQNFQSQGPGPASLYIRGVDIPNPLIEEQ